MNIIVTIKQVPDTNDVKIDPQTGTLIREGVPSIVNPEDCHAVELAVELKEKIGSGKVTLLSMGPPQAETALREMLAYGADEAILVSDRVFAGADTLATAAALYYAIRKIGKFDLILCGRQAIDGDTAQVGPQLAEFLRVPQITYAKKVEWENGKFRVLRAIDGGTQVLEASAPVLITCLKELNKPRIPTLKGCMAAYRDLPFHIRTNKDIGAPPELVGLKGSPTQVRKTFSPPPRGEGVILTGDPELETLKIVKILQEKSLIGAS